MSSVNKEIDYTKIYQALNDYGTVYLAGIYNNYPIVIGAILLVAFASLSLGNNSPSYNACLMSQSIILYVLIVICNIILFSIVGLHFINDLLPITFAQLIRSYKHSTLYVIILMLIFFYGIMFFSCQDNLNCKDCDVTQMTANNRKVIDQVNTNPIITTLMKYYEQQMNPRNSIVYCSNFYDATYLTKKNCQPIKDVPKCNPSLDLNVGAPVLSDFFILSSCNTCFVSHDIYGYVTDKMIDVVLQAGARFLDFGIYPLDLKKNSVPIVGRNFQKDNTPIHYNYVLLEDCFKRIVDNYFNGGSPNVIKEPLFIHLKINDNVNTGTMNNIASLIKYYFVDYNNSSLLLDTTYNDYNNLNLGMVPICLLHNKAIICVSTSKKQLSPALDELVALRFGTGFSRRYYWSQVKTIPSVADMVKFNQKKLTCVFPSRNPYSMIPNDDDKDPRPEEYFIASLSLNNDPVVPLSYGCQFVCMNFHNLDDDMLKYLGLFKSSSYVLRPTNLRRKENSYAEYTDQDGVKKKIICDPNGMVDNVNTLNSMCQAMSGNATAMQPPPSTPT